jgi:membrane dipeptidase
MEQKRVATRRDVLKAVGASTVTLATSMINCGRHRVFAFSTNEYSARAIELVGRSTVIDMLSPLTLNFSKQAKWFANPESFTMADLTPFKDSSINVFHIAIGMGGPEAYLETLRFFAAWNGFIANHDESFMRIDSTADLERVKRSGKIGILLGLQNADHFRKLDDVDFFRGVGQRVSQLTYNSRNLIGNGSTERRDEGISDFGVAIIERMNKVGMADVSHCGDRTTPNAFEFKNLFSSSLKLPALVAGHPRYKADEAKESRRGRASWE